MRKQQLQNGQQDTGEVAARSRERSPEPDGDVHLAVVVPTRNEVDNVAPLLRRLEVGGNDRSGMRSSASQSDPASPAAQPIARAVPESVMAQIASWSFIDASEGERAALARDSERVLRAQAGPAAEMIAVPYRTQVRWARRASSS